MDFFASLPAAQRFLEQAEDSLFQKKPLQALDNYIQAEQLLFEALYGVGADGRKPDAQMAETYIYTLRKVGDVCVEIGDFARGITWYIETIHKNEKSSGTDPKTFIYLYAKVGEIQLYNQQPSEAGQSLARAKQWATKCAHQSTSVEVLEALIGLQSGDIKGGLSTLLRLYTQATGTAYFTLYFRNQVLSYLARVDNPLLKKKARELAETDFLAAFTAAGEAREQSDFRLALRLYLLCLDKVHFLPEGALPIDKVFATNMQVGRIISSLGFHRASCEYFEQCMWLRDLSGISPELQIECYYWHGRAFTSMKDYGAAFRTFEGGLRLARRHKVPFLLFQLQHEIAMVLAKSGKNIEANALLGQLANDLNQLPDGRDKDLAFARYNNELAFAQARKYAWDSALKMYQASLARIEAHGCTIEYGKTIRGLGLARLYAAESEPATAEKLLLESVEIFNRLQAADERNESLKACGEMFLRRGKIDAAMKHIDTAITRLEYNNNRDELPLLYGLKAKILCLQEQYAQATLFYKKDLEIARGTDNIRSLAMAFLNLGSVLQNQGNYPVAEENLRQAQKYAELINNPTLRISAHLALALNHAQLKDKAATDGHVQQAELLWAQERDNYFWAKLLITKGTCNCLLKSGPGEVLLREGIQALKKIDPGHFDLIEASYQLADCCYENNQAEAGHEILRETIDHCRRVGLTAKTVKYSRLLNSLLGKSGMAAPAGRTVAPAPGPIRPATSPTASSPPVPAGWAVKNTELSLLAIALKTPAGPSPEALQSLLSSLHRAAPAIIVRQGGTFTHLIGNQLLAVFNLRGNLPDHLALATSAAVELSAKIDSDLSQPATGQPPDCGIGIGIASGNALAAATGPTAEAKFAIIGEIVDIAVALAEAAQPGRILVTESAGNQLGSAFPGESVSPLTVAGQSVSARLLGKPKQ